MSSFFGISDSFFGMNETNTSYGGNNILGDYAAIKNGSYKKLLNAYYSKTSSDTDKVDEDSEETKKEKTSLLETKSQSENLKKVAEELKNNKLFEGTKDETTGKVTYDMEKITEKLESFVKSYNDMIDASAEVDSKGVLRKTLWLIEDTKANSKLLNDIGISVGKDNKLTLDKAKVKEADIYDMKSLFEGSNSYIGKVSSKMSEIWNLSNGAINELSGNKSYTNKGDYNTLTTNALYNKLF